MGTTFTPQQLYCYVKVRVEGLGFRNIALNLWNMSWKTDGTYNRNSGYVGVYRVHMSILRDLHILAYDAFPGLSYSGSRDV